MRHEVFVRFAHGREFALPVADAGGMPSEEARRSLDEQFVDNECEPLRASGKVLTADKVLALPDSAGPARFESDPAWATNYARATLAALGVTTVRVDVDSGTVTF